MINKKYLKTKPDKNNNKKDDYEILIVGDWNDCDYIAAKYNFTENELKTILPQLVISKHFYDWFNKNYPNEDIDDTYKDNIKLYINEFNIENDLLNILFEKYKYESDEITNVIIDSIKEVLENLHNSVTEYLPYEEEYDKFIHSIITLQIKLATGIYEIDTKNYIDALVELVEDIL